MARLAAARRDDGHRGDHALEIVGGCLVPDQNDAFTLLCQLNGLARRKYDPAGSGARRGRVSDRERSVFSIRIYHRVQNFVEPLGLDSPDGLLTRDQLFIGHLDRDAN